jgi:hypothetical protein
MFGIVYGGLMLGVCGPLAFLLIRSQASYSDVRRQLQSSEQAYERLISARPFPSPENVDAVRADLTRADACYQDLRGTLCRGDIRAELMARDLFGERLQVTRDRLLALASANGVKLTEDFFFGFERYADGTLPRDEQIPRLTVQLKYVEALAEVLLEGRVDTVEAFRRDVFEQEDEEEARVAAVGRRGRSASSPAPDPALPEADDRRPFEVEPLAVAFTARDEQVWNVLDRLAALSMFAVPKTVRLTTLSPEDGEVPSPDTLLRRIVREQEESPLEDRFRRQGGGLTAARQAAPESGMEATRAEAVLRAIPHDERLLAGRRERVKVELELEVYRFCAADESTAHEADPGSGGRS